MEKIKLTGLWKNTDKSGGTYYAGNLSHSLRLLVFKNTFKKTERDPDLVVHAVSAEKRPAAPGAGAAESPRLPDREGVPF